MTRSARTLTCLALLVVAMAAIEAVRALATHERFARIGALFIVSVAGLLIITACALFERQRITWRLAALGTGWTAVLLVPSQLESEWLAGHGVALARPELHGWVTPAVLLMTLAAAGAIQLHHLNRALFEQTYE